MEVLSKEFITTLGPVEFQLYRIVTYWEVFTCAELSPNSASPWIVDATCLQSWIPPAIFTTVPLDRNVSTSWADLRGVSLEAFCAVASWASPSTFTTFYSMNVASMRYCMYSGFFVTLLVQSIQSFQHRHLPVRRSYVCNYRSINPRWPPQILCHSKSLLSHKKILQEPNLGAWRPSDRHRCDSWYYSNCAYAKEHSVLSASLYLYRARNSLDPEQLWWCHS